MRAPPGLDVVEDILRRESDVLARRADATDTRAGMLLAFAGLLASLGSGGWPPLALATRIVALLAGLAGVWTLRGSLPQQMPAAALRDLLEHEPGRVRLVALRHALLRHDADYRRVARKVAHARLASQLVVLALASALTSATVEVLR